MYRKKLIALLLVLPFAFSAKAQNQSADEQAKTPHCSEACHSTPTPSTTDAVSSATPQKSFTRSLLDRISLSGYGTVNYHNYLQYDTDL